MRTSGTLRSHDFFNYKTQADVLFSLLKNKAAKSESYRKKLLNIHQEEKAVVTGTKLALNYKKGRIICGDNLLVPKDWLNYSKNISKERHIVQKKSHTNLKHR